MYSHHSVLVALSLTGLVFSAGSGVAQSAQGTRPVAQANVAYQAPQAAQPGVAANATVVGTFAAPQSEQDRMDNSTLLKRGAVIGVTGAGAHYAVGKVSGVVRGAANVGKVGNVTHWGPAVAAVPVFGGSAAAGSVVPTTLGQVPVMGPIVSKVPVAGPIVAGPANPILVGAVAVDNYVIPKYSPCGYTKSSVVAATNDFNSPPKLRHYVNYLAPQPYSHPPIYSPNTINTDLPADLAYIDGHSQAGLNNLVRVPDM